MRFFRVDMKEIGFTLLEMLITILIGSIIVVLSFQSMKELILRNELFMATQQLMRFFDEVKNDANFSNQNHIIYLFAEQNGESCLTVSNELRPLQCDGAFKLILPSNINISGLTQKNTVAFYGRRSTAQSGTIKLQNAVGETRVIISVRGRIRLCSYNLFLSGMSKC